MINILGFIGIIITLLVVVPASLSALIRILAHPVREITNLWITLADQIIDIIETVKNDFKK
jgi:hypothetical protein